MMHSKELGTHLFGINIIDRASRLVASDAAEEQNARPLVQRLRDTAYPLVLEPGPPPTMLPELTAWTMRDHKAGVRRAKGLLRRCVGTVKSDCVYLQIVRGGDGRCFESFPEDWGWNPWHWQLIRFNAVWAPATILSPEECYVRPGVAMLHSYPHPAAAPVLHIHPADAPRFGLLYVPGFPIDEGAAP